MKISAIIPAYNEDANVAQIVLSLTRSKIFDEIIVIDDGSTDDTALKARQAGARVIRQENKGKGGAMQVGASLSRGDILCFFDADICNLTPSIIKSLIKPIQNGSAVMTIGLRDKPWFTSLMNRLGPVLGGERAMLRSVFSEMLTTRYGASADFGIETVMNGYCEKKKLPIEYVPMPGVRHVVKEMKYGFWKGFFARLSMIYQIIKAEIEIMKMK